MLWWLVGGYGFAINSVGLLLMLIRRLRACFEIYEVSEKGCCKDKAACRSSAKFLGYFSG